MKKEELEKAMEGFIRIVIEIIEHKDEVINILEEYEGVIKERELTKAMCRVILNMFENEKHD